VKRYNKQTITRLKNYSDVTTTRQLRIKWEKVQLLTRQTKKQINQLYPQPYGQIKSNRAGIALGKYIHMHGAQTKAVQHRLQKAKQTWGIARKRLSQNRNIPTKLRIQLWNALIRSTLTYALQTQELTAPLENKLNAFTQKCMRQITEKTWYAQTQPTKQNHKTARTHTIPDNKSAQPSPLGWKNKTQSQPPDKQTHEKNPPRNATPSNKNKKRMGKNLAPNKTIPPTNTDKRKGKKQKANKEHATHAMNNLPTNNKQHPKYTQYRMHIRKK